MKSLSYHLKSSLIFTKVYYIYNSKHSYKTYLEMKKSTFKPLLVLFFALFCFGISAQNNALWTKAQNTETESLQKEFRKTLPLEYNLFQLNTPALKAALAQAPERNNGTSNVIIKLPTNNGELQNFRVFEASVFAPELQARHTDTRSYVAKGIDDPTATARFSVSSIGLNAMITSGKYPTVYIDPYTQNKNFYITYNINQLPANPDGFDCLVEEAIGPEPFLNERNANDGKLRTYRLAVACNRFYAQFHLTDQGIPASATDAVKKAAVLAAMNVTMTRVNGIYERDLSLTMVLIPNNEDIIFLDAATDPYAPNQNAQTLINQNQTVIDDKIGFDNYDIGHLFSTGAGGLAQLRSPCTANKARGITGTNYPKGDAYDIDYVSHEMGHQYGANHTFNNACGGNRNNGTAVEPGSGSTIMAYAGICPPNVQNRSDDYFSGRSIQEMWINISVGRGDCGVQTNTNNQPPVADAGPNRTIPKSTAFILQGTASDPDGDALTHCWEQMDTQIAPMPPLKTSTNGPAFRTLTPTDSPERYMPKINFVLIGDLGGNTPSTGNKWEAVPAVARTLNFRYTVRDNAAGGGATASSNTVLTIDGNSGPFAVTSQSDPDPSVTYTWTTQTTETITWDVANSDAAPVNCANVDIKFSTDGGFTYPITIASNIPNNGSATINVPNVNTNNGRIMVKASDNIFYALNGKKIVVTGTVGVEDFTFDNFSVYPNPSSGVFNLSFTPASNENIEVSLYDIRGRIINQFIYDDVSASGLFSKQLDYNYIDSGMYFLVVKNGNKTATKKLMKN